MNIIFLAVIFILAFNYEYAEASSINERVGVVKAKGNLLCFITSNRKVNVGSISVVFLTSPQKLVNSAIAQINDRKCADTSNGISGRHRLSLGYNSTHHDVPAIGILDASDRLRQVGNEVVGDLDGDGINEFFRSCASLEGIHLTIWSSQAITGILRWHQYYYVGYDLEPTCSKLEMPTPTP